MRHVNMSLVLSSVLFCATASGCLIVLDDDRSSEWDVSPEPTCDYICDAYGCWEICYDQITCQSNDECDWGLYCDLNLDSYYYGQCVTSPAGVCTTSDDCQLDGYVCDQRDTCVPGEPPPPPTCEDYATEADCAADQACAPVYSGINCTTPDGDVCGGSDAGSNCTCESFVFARCEPFVTP